MKNFVFYFFSIATLVSCRPKPIDIDVNSEEEKLVIFSEAIPDHSIFISVTKTFSPLKVDPVANVNDILIKDAKITLTSNSGNYTFVPVKPGLYASYNTFPFKTGQIFNLTVEAEGKIIHSTSTMLQGVKFNTIEPIVEKLAKDTNIYVNFSFSDIPNEDNWYLLNFYKKQPIDSDYSNYFNNGSNTNCKTIILSDKEFNNLYSKKIELENVTKKDSIAVTLSNISENYFNYLNFRISNGNVLNQLNMEPINYPTNIINGYGFFNTHNPDIHYFDLTKY